MSMRSRALRRPSPSARRTLRAIRAPPSPHPRKSTITCVCSMRAGGGTDALRDYLFELRKKGFNRLYQNGRVFEFSTPESLLDIDFAQPVFILADRFVISPD